MTDITIARATSGDLSCLPGYTEFPICDTTGNCTQQSLNISASPSVQVCKLTTITPEGSDTLYDQTSVITDIKFSDMEDTQKSIYLPRTQRCCDSNDTLCEWFPPLSLDIANPNADEAGEIPISVDGCRKQGLCIQKQTIQGLKQSNGKYLPANNIVFVTAPASTSQEEICSAVNQSRGGGFTTDGINLFDSCESGTPQDQNGVYICKKYANFQ